MLEINVYFSDFERKILGTVNLMKTCLERQLSRLFLKKVFLGAIQIIRVIFLDYFRPLPPPVCHFVLNALISHVLNPPSRTVAFCVKFQDPSLPPIFILTRIFE